MTEKVVLIKIAAMGDVAMTCRALKEFATHYETKFEIHWLIDSNLVPLTRAMLNHPPAASTTLSITYHPIDGTNLFRGTVYKKAREALKIFWTTLKIKPQHVVLLHRDWRYKALIRTAFQGSLLGVTRVRRSELLTYKNILEDLAVKMALSKKKNLPHSTIECMPSHKIGILVGGAQNQKITFKEKRWPHTAELLDLLLKQTTYEILLFGGPDDIEIAAQLVNRTSSPRITNLVGKLTLDELPNTLGTLSRFISIDSGLAHIAAATMSSKHQRIITLFGPTDPQTWAPLASGEASSTLHYKATPCSPCYSDDGIFKPCRFEGQKFQHCMNDIHPVEVFKSLL